MTQMKEQEKRLVGLRKELKELVDEQKGGSSSNNNSVEYINEKRMYLRGEVIIAVIVSLFYC